ncbi:MAG: prepilin-type N-terminal cleavage/methylation domain-containing protein [Candidatus Accumulibacter sp.]|jgi:type IV pilus assembly protein PilE|nr:prepilin-type N-terminal cleavage/methylation domain-containing protein [Accumulibacter sp.]
MTSNMPGKNDGFTLIEIMVVVVIVAILSAIAVPTYKDYVIRSKITQAISGLSAVQVRMEQCYQDNHSYKPASGKDCCERVDVSALTKNFEYFKFSCDASSATTFLLTAEGIDQLSGFKYAVNQADTRSTEITGASGWAVHSPNNCWVTRKDGTC